MEAMEEIDLEPWSQCAELSLSWRFDACLGHAMNFDRRIEAGEEKYEDAKAKGEALTEVK
jgi:hypothetical protein